MKRLFDKVLVCPPGEGYPNCLSTHPERKTINLTLARRQHEEYVHNLRKQEIDVELLPPQDSLPDSVFIQDPALVGKNTVLLGRSREYSRQPETEIIAQYFEKNGKTLRRISPTATLEGGDVLITEEKVFVGITGRTNHEGFLEVQQAFPEVEVKPIRFSSGFFHLLSACSYLADNQLLTCGKYADTSNFGGFDCLSVAPEDVIAVNVLHMGRGRVLMPQGFNRVWNLLQKFGYEAIEIDNSEFVKGDGRITCLSSPIYSNLE